MTAIDRFWELLSGVLSLNPEAFNLIQTLPLGEKAALYTIILAGFSQALGQSIILLINKVKPSRFILSLVIATILFAFGYIFWVTITWLCSQLLLSQSISYLTIATTLGLAYTPLTLSFFVAFPYLGVPLSILLSIWSLLAFLIGLKAILGISISSAFWCSILGWVIKEILARRIGGQVNHRGIGSAFDDPKFLPDGRNYLRQTLDLVTGVIQGISPLAQATTQRKISNYQLYQQGFFNQPSYYPLNQSVDPELYCEIAPWMGRLILPELAQRPQVRGVFLEVYHAPKDYQFLVGQVIILRWSNDPQVQKIVRSVTKDLHFSEEALSSQSQGNIHPERLNHWQQIDPLESLAGSRPNDDQIVMLREPITIEIASKPGEISRLLIANEPVQITGRFYGLVKILRPVKDEEDRFLAVHFNRNSRLFNGVEEVICIPQVIANVEGIFSSTSKDIEKSPVNGEGWYIYGAKNVAGVFVVQAIAPRSLLRLQPDEVVFGVSEAQNYVKKHCWQDILAQKGKTKSALLSPQKEGIKQAIAQWEEGDRALLLHVYGGIGGKKAESAARSPIFFGHFAYGTAKIVRDRLTQELVFDIEYHQVYTQNTDGLIAGTQHWSRYMGDRQFGWLGTRPIADILIKLDAFTEDYDIKGLKRSAMDILIDQLEAMEARYRIGDGTGGTYVGPAHNCSQDSNQAVYTTIKQIEIAVNSYPDLQNWLEDNPSQAALFYQLIDLGKLIKNKLSPFGSARTDWINNENNLGISLEEDAFTGLFVGLKSWPTLFPRLASETIALILIEQGASAWILRTNQVGGNDPDIQPIAPTPIG
jgi:predicted Abi (CAAX) family protease